MSTTIDKKSGTCNCAFVVEDTGPGISGHDKEKIFESFNQGSNGTATAHGGTGLGLSIVKELVQAMDGTIKLVSEVGQGSTFELFLPLHVADPSAQEKHLDKVDAQIQLKRPVIEEDSLVRARKELKILLAEDNPTTQSLISILIEQMGFDLTIVDNGQAAVEFLEMERVDLILMDCQMPKMDGYAATTLLRSRGIETPVIALTAYARAEDEEECMNAGMNDFLSKPFRQAEMSAILEKWLPLIDGEKLEFTGTSTG
jgi:CheY-like chemotaxis protein